MGNIMSGHDLISKMSKKPVYGMYIIKQNETCRNERYIVM